MKKFSRRGFIVASGLATGALMLPSFKSPFGSPFGWLDDPVEISAPQPTEDIFSYINRVKGRFDLTLYRKIIGSANHFKEGDLAQPIKTCLPPFRVSRWAN